MTFPSEISRISRIMLGFKNRTSFYEKTAWVTIIAATLFRLLYAGTFPLVPDETNYWQWGRHLAWGYHDQAPMIGWGIRFFTTLFGQNEVAVRMPSIFAIMIASFYIAKIGFRWVGPKTGLWATALFQTVFAVNLGALLATADAVQALGWVAASYHVARAYEENTWKQWLLGGAWFGFGMISKFSMLLFLPPAYLFGLLSGYHRPILKTLKPYVGVLLGLVIFSPVFIWNASHNFNAFRHVAHLGGVSEFFSIHWKFIGDFIASQIGLMSPLVAVTGGITCWMAKQKKLWPSKWIYRYILITSLFVIAFFLLLSVHVRIYANWPMMGYTCLVVIMAAFLIGEQVDTTKKTSPKTKLWFWALATSFIYTGIILLHLYNPIAYLPARMDPTISQTAGWVELGQVLGKELQNTLDVDNTFLFSEQYQISSEMAFYTPGQPETVSINRWSRPNVYDYWWKDEDLIGKNAIGVAYDENLHKGPMQELFDRIDPPICLPILREIPYSGGKTEIAKMFYIYRAYGFKGGLRWVPPANDIRASS